MHTESGALIIRLSSFSNPLVTSGEYFFVTLVLGASRSDCHNYSLWQLLVSEVFRKSDFSDKCMIFGR